MLADQWLALSLLLTVLGAALGAAGAVGPRWRVVLRVASALAWGSTDRAPAAEVASCRLVLRRFGLSSAAALLWSSLALRVRRARRRPPARGHDAPRRRWFN